MKSFLLILALLCAPSAVRAANPGDACGAVQREGGVTMVCDGANWLRITESDGAANLGVKQAAPKAPLHVGGEAIIGVTTGLACDADREGGIRWNAADKTVEVCDGTSWSRIVAAACDQLPAFFEFTDEPDVTASTLITSDIVQITGLDDPGCNVDVSISGGGSPEYRICTDGSSVANCDGSIVQDWTAAISTLDMNNKYVLARLTSSASTP